MLYVLWLAALAVWIAANGTVATVGAVIFLGLTIPVVVLAVIALIGVIAVSR